LWVALVARVGALAGGSRDCVAPFRRKCDHSLGRPLGFWVFVEMELSFIVESKTFVFSVLDGASMLGWGRREKASLGKFSLVLRHLSGWL
jgi:hypothetical protein